MSLPVATHWYDTEPLSNGVTWIDELHVLPSAVGNIWLVAGSQSCLVFDTGTGLGDLADKVAELTDKPVIALASTGYYDHAGGLGQFGQRAVHRLEAPRVQSPTPHNTVSEKYLTYAVLKATPYENFLVGEYVMAPTQPTQLLEDGATLELGDRCLRVLHTPGVTAGSIALYEEKTGSLFSGESLSDSEKFYTGEPADYSTDANAQAHRESMQKLLALDVSTVYPGHHSPFDGRRLRQILEPYLFG